MALVKGTNCGFVTVAPTTDPSGSNSTMDDYAKVLKDTTPANINIVTEIGWWCGSATEAADFQVGIYTHNAGDDRPDSLVVAANTAAKGADSGWKKVTGLSIPVSPSTIYWIGSQLDDISTVTYTDYSPTAGEKYRYVSGQTSLPSPWGALGTEVEGLLAFYAVVVRKNSGILNWVFMKDAWKKHNKLWTPKLALPNGYNI